MEIRLRARRLACGTTGCAYGRNSLALVRMLRALGLALAGQAAARVAGRLGVLISRSTMLRLVRGLPDPGAGGREGARRR